MNNNIFCENCGKEIKQNDKFCEYCGFNFTSKKSNHSQIIKSKSKPLILTIIVISILVNGYFLIDKHYKLKDSLQWHKQKNVKLEKRLEQL